MSIKVFMPSLSPTMEKGKIIKWHVSQGDVVHVGDIVAEIETDKAIMEYESVYDGVVQEILYKEGSSVAVSELIMTIDGEEDSPKEESNNDVVEEKLNIDTKKSSISNVKKEEKRIVIESDVIPSSPLARKIARESNISLDDVRYLAPKRRVVASDVRKFLHEKNQEDVSKQVPLDEFCKIHNLNQNNFVLREMTSLEKLSSDLVTDGFSGIPHFSLSFSCCVDDIISFRQKINTCFSENKVSFSDVLIFCSIFAYKKVPTCLCSYSSYGILTHKNPSISLAVLTKKNTLITPVIHNAFGKNLLLLSQEMRDLVMRGREGKLAYHEYKGDILSISNLGMYGVESFTSILTGTQSMILSVGTTRKEGDRKYVSFTLTADHRVLHGVLCAQWIQYFRMSIEDPSFLAII